MFILGALGFLQITLIPGAIILGLLRYHGRPIQVLLYAFGSSLLINYILVGLLSAAGLYRQPVMIGLLLVELILATWVYKKFLITPIGEVFSRAWNALVSFWRNLLQPAPANRDDTQNILLAIKGMVTIIFAILAFSSVWWSARVFYLNLGTVFNSWDAVVSWNRWAVQWVASQGPVGSGWYPQLIPANWSLTYALMGNTSIQFFAKATAPLFLLGILLAMFDLALEKRALGVFIAVTLTRLMIKKFLGEFITEGYVDIPVAFLGFLAGYALLRARENPDPEITRRDLWLGAGFAAGAALTKPTGAIVLVLYPLFSWLFVLRDHPEGQPKLHSRSILLPFLSSLIVVLPWYIYKAIEIRQGVDASNVEWLTVGIYHGMTIIERLKEAALTLDKYGFVILFLLPALLVLSKVYRYFVVLIVLPTTLIWALYFSYDARNIAIALPYIGFTAGAGMAGYMDLAFEWTSRLRLSGIKTWALAGALILPLLVLGYLFRTETLENRQEHLQKQIFNPSLNAKLYAYLEGAASDNPHILTNYPLAYLPGLSRAQVEFWFHDYQQYLGLIAQPEIDYLLVPSTADEAILQDIEHRLANSEFQSIFSDDNFIPYRFIRIIGR